MSLTDKLLSLFERGIVAAEKIADEMPKTREVMTKSLEFRQALGDEDIPQPAPGENAAEAPAAPEGKKPKGSGRPTVKSKTEDKQEETFPTEEDVADAVRAYYKRGQENDCPLETLKKRFKKIRDKYNAESIEDFKPEDRAGVIAAIEAASIEE